MDKHSNIRGSYLAFGTAAATLTLISPSTHRFLSGCIPVFLGKISFGVYIIHLPLICSFSSWAYLTSVSTLGPGAAAFIVSAVTCGLSIFLGYLLYLIAARPGIRLSRWLSSLIMNTSRIAVLHTDAIAIDKSFENGYFPQDFPSPLERASDIVVACIKYTKPSSKFYK